MAHQKKNLRSELDRNIGLSITTQEYTHTQNNGRNQLQGAKFLCLKAWNNEDDSQQYSQPYETMPEEILSVRKARKGVMLHILGTWLAGYG